jgi:hypothetical protein
MSWWGKLEVKQLVFVNHGFNKVVLSRRAWGFMSDADDDDDDDDENDDDDDNEDDEAK